jgi:hypothetical protein
VTEIYRVADAGGDHLLRTIARLAQEHSVTTGITLTVGGVVVTGIVVGRDAWLQRFVAALSATGDQGQATGESLEHQFLQADLQRSGQESYDFLHLDDARFVYSVALRPPPPVPGQLWRGRISEISGWTFGRYQN